mgnify:CR=1 FL=1
MGMRSFNVVIVHQNEVVGSFTIESVQVYFNGQPQHINWVIGDSTDEKGFKELNEFCFVDELDYFSSSIPQKHPPNEWKSSAEELGTKSKNNLREITLGI